MNPVRFRQLTIVDAVTLLGLSTADVTQDTYIYLSQDFQLIAIEKPQRDADPVDELMGMGYASVHEEFAEISVQEAAEIKGVSVQAVRDILRSETRKAKIFPSARFIGTSPERGEWRVRLSEVEAWQPRQK